MEFKDKLLKLIKDAGITQKELAQKSGVTEAAISRYIHGTRTPNMGALILIKQALECQWDDLIGA